MSKQRHDRTWTFVNHSRANPDSNKDLIRLPSPGPLNAGLQYGTSPSYLTFPILEGISSAWLHPTYNEHFWLLRRVGYFSSHGEPGTSNLSLHLHSGIVHCDLLQHRNLGWSQGRSGKAGDEASQYILTKISPLEQPWYFSLAATANFSTMSLSKIPKVIHLVLLGQVSSLPLRAITSGWSVPATM